MRPSLHRINYKQFSLIINLKKGFIITKSLNF